MRTRDNDPDFPVRGLLIVGGIIGTGQNNVDERDISSAPGSSVWRTALPTRQLEVEAGGWVGGAGRVSERENIQMKRMNPRTMAMRKKRDGPPESLLLDAVWLLRLMDDVDRSTQGSSALTDESPDPRGS